MTALRAASAGARFEPGIDLIGPAQTPWQRDAVFRGLEEAIATAGLLASVTRWDPDPDGPVGAPGAAAGHDICILFLEPQELPGFAYGVPAGFFADRYAIGVWLGDGVSVADPQSALALLDEIWVPSAYAADGLATRTAKPVHVLPIPVGPPSGTVRPRSELRLPGGFLFLSAVDLARGIEIGNPIGVLQAFLRAFPSDTGAGLAIRTSNPHCFRGLPERLRRTADRPDVRILDERLADGDERALVEACDCYFSLERASAFGLHEVMAMASGKPVVAAGYSGGLALLDEGRSYPVGVHPRPLPAAHALWWTGPEWANPDVDDAARKLRSIHLNQEEAAEVGRRAAVAVREGQSRTAAFVAERCREIRQATGSRPAASAVDRAAAFVEHGPLNRWEAPARFGRVGVLARRALVRALRPYTTRRAELDRSVVEALEDNAASGRALRAQLAAARLELGESRRLLDLQGRRLDGVERALVLATRAERGTGDGAPGRLPEELIALHRSLAMQGMTTAQERAWCHRYARDRFTGEGELVELGAWLGSLTAALAMGLAGNPNAQVQALRVHTHDRFLWDVWLDDHPVVVGSPLEGCYAPGESFRAEFEARVAPWLGLIEIHEGDLTRAGWHGRGIELLVVDAMKTWELANSILVSFYSHLLPGVGLLFHQDFAHYAHTWIHLLTYRLRNFFEHVEHVDGSDAVVFRLLRPIPEDVLSHGYSLDSFSREEIDAAFEYSLTLVRGVQRFDVAAAKILVLIELGDTAAARRELERWHGAPEGTDLAEVERLLRLRTASGTG